MCVCVYERERERDKWISFAFNCKNSHHTWVLCLVVNIGVRCTTAHRVGNDPALSLIVEEHAQPALLLSVHVSPAHRLLLPQIDAIDLVFFD